MLRIFKAQTGGNFKNIEPQPKETGFYKRAKVNSFNTAIQYGVLFSCMGRRAYAGCLDLFVNFDEIVKTFSAI